MIFPFIVAVC